MVEPYSVDAKTKDIVSDVLALTGICADTKAYAPAADMLWPGASLTGTVSRLARCYFKYQLPEL